MLVAAAVGSSLVRASGDGKREREHRSYCCCISILVMLYLALDKVVISENGEKDKNNIA